MNSAPAPRPGKPNRAKTTAASTAGSFAAKSHSAPGAAARLIMPEQRAYDWRADEVVVEGRRFTGADVYGGRLFHGSVHELPVGTTLEPGKADANFKESAPDAVSLTSAANTALHWATEAAGGPSTTRPRFVYEVEPLGPIGVWRAMLANYGRSWRLQEGRVPAARIVRRISLDDARDYESNLGRDKDPLALTAADEEKRA